VQLRSPNDLEAFAGEFPNGDSRGRIA